MQLTWESITSVLQIVVIDVVLSGDNAVVIAMAAHRLPQRQRRLAIQCGAAGAIVLRVLFTWILAQLLAVPLLRFGGGLILVWIAMKLLFEEEEDLQDSKVREARSLLHAVRIIIMADFVMSLDNMLAVGGAAGTSAVLILFGLVLSIGFIMTCSAFITEWMNRYPILVVMGAAVLAWTAAEMMIEDAKVAEFIVSRQHLCVDGSWDKDYGGPPKESGSIGWWQKLHGTHKATEATPWWLETEHELNHRHWIGWTIVGVVIAMVVVLPQYWNTVTGRRHAKTTPASASAEIAPSNPAADTTKPGEPEPPST